MVCYSWVQHNYLQVSLAEIFFQYVIYFLNKNERFILLTIYDISGEVKHENFESNKFIKVKINYRCEKMTMIILQWKYDLV